MAVRTISPQTNFGTKRRLGAALLSPPLLSDKRKRLTRAVCHPRVRRVALMLLAACIAIIGHGEIDSIKRALPPCGGTPVQHVGPLAEELATDPSAAVGSDFSCKERQRDPVETSRKVDSVEFGIASAKVSVPAVDMTAGASLGVITGGGGDLPYRVKGLQCVVTNSLWPLPAWPNRPLTKQCLVKIEPISGRLPLQSGVSGSFCASNKRRVSLPRRPAPLDRTPQDATGTSTASFVLGEGFVASPFADAVVASTMSRDWWRMLRLLPNTCPEMVTAAPRVVVIVAMRGAGSREAGMLSRPWFRDAYGRFQKPTEFHLLDPCQDSWHVTPRTSKGAWSGDAFDITRHHVLAADRAGFATRIRANWTLHDTQNTAESDDWLLSPTLETAQRTMSVDLPVGASLLETVPTVDLASFLRQHVKAQDFVVLMMDVDGLEWKVADRLASTGAWSLVDEAFVECHNAEWLPSWPTRHSPADCHRLLNTLRSRGVFAHEWFD